MRSGTPKSQRLYLCPIFTSDVDFSTNSNFNFFLYQLVNFIDPTHNGAIGSIDGLNYSNNAFTECSVHSLSLSAYLTPVGLELEAPVSPPIYWY
jgi:hypothetical protein